MKIKFLSFLLGLVLISFGLQTIAAVGDTTSIISHNKHHWAWYGAKDSTVYFPSKVELYRKILLQYTLGCPSGKNCSGWDYTTRIELLKKNSDGTLSKPIELARVITPYGGYYNDKWNFTWTFDLTDYEPLLHDSTIIRAFYGGYSDGFTITLNFQFIKGTPPVPILSVQNLYTNGTNGISYGNYSDFIKNFTPSQISFPTNANGARIYSTISGHGFDNDKLAGEFDSGFYFQFKNSKKETLFNTQVWRNNCGANTLSHQSGTWIYDRANWCPGDAVKSFVNEVGDNFQNSKFIKKSDSKDSLYVDFTDYSWSGKQTPSYYFDAQLITYGNNNFNNNVSLEDIVSPSNKSIYSKINPVCSNPMIKVKNNGKNNITKLSFIYGLEGSTDFNSYQWTGNLIFNEIQIISLPYPTRWRFEKGKTFYVKAISVNDKTDEDTSDNLMNSTYNVVLDFPTDFYIYLRTNKRPEENSYILKDGFGNIIRERRNFTKKQSLYLDTISKLPSGCYTLSLYDESKDGLSYWADTAAGNGTFSLRKKNTNNSIGAVIKTFEPDFGTVLTYNFTVGNGIVAVENQADHSSIWDIDIYPNPVVGNQEIKISQKNEFHTRLECKLFNINGKLMQSWQINNQEDFKLKTLEYSSGIYILKIQNEEGNSIQKKVILR